MEIKAILYEELQSNARRPWVIVATPHEEPRRLIAGMLRDQDLEVSELGDPLELFGGGFPKVEEAPRRPDLLVVEAEEPGVRGLEIVQRLRGLDPTLPVVLLTPRMDVAMAEEAEALGVECVLEHPFDYADLRTAALAALEPDHPNWSLL
jgi:two-component system, NtrC family, C4-dicarboxylate transport response regulator DctD